MKFFVTGELGFIAKNLTKSILDAGHTQVTVVGTGLGAALLRTSSRSGSADVSYDMREPCVHLNTPDRWAKFLIDNSVDVVIHNAAVVGTDVVALNPREAVLTNVLGTQNIVKACEMAKIPVCYMGTSVIYRTEAYQHTYIDEKSEVLPKTLYGIQKQAGDLIVKRAETPWMIVRPLFAYGGIGDMNSLIAKAIYASYTGRDKLDMFLDPNKVKDYIHVTDYCDAVILACQKSLWNHDLIVAAETPRRTSEIIELIDSVSRRENLPSKIMKWHPETDYLGNHRLSSSKFRHMSGWEPKISLEEGIKMSRDSIVSSLTESSYNPLTYLDEARQKGIDLTKFY